MNEEHYNWIDQYLEGSLPEEKWEEFNSLLAGSPELRRQLRKQALLNDYLHEFALAKEPEVFRFSDKAKRVLRVPSLIFAAASLVFALWAYLFQPQQSLPERHPQLSHSTPEPITDTCAFLLDFHNLKTSEQSHSLSEFEVKRGNYEIENGSLHLRFGKVVDFLFEGPGKFEILNEQKVKLINGKVRVISLCSESSRFTILSESNKYVFTGTELCLSVSPNQKDKLNLKDGRFTVVENKSAKQKEVTVSSVNVNTGDLQKLFTTCVDSGFKNLDLGLNGRSRYQEHFRRIASDPDVVGLYSFEHIKKAKKIYTDFLPKAYHSLKGSIEPYRIVPNFAKTKISSHGVLTECNRGKGRWPHTESVNFFRPKSGMSLFIPGQYRNFSLSAWIKPMDRPRGNHFSFRATAWDSVGKFRFIATRTGYFKNFIWGEKYATSYPTQNNPVSDLNENWKLITYVISNINGRLQNKIYHNDRLIYQTNLQNTNFIQMDDCIIGTDSSINAVTRALNCRLDELVIWKKTLTSKEISAYFKIGYPYYLLEGLGSANLAASTPHSSNTQLTKY